MACLNLCAPPDFQRRPRLPTSARLEGKPSPSLSQGFPPHVMQWRLQPTQAERMTNITLLPRCDHRNPQTLEEAEIAAGFDTTKPLKSDSNGCDDVFLIDYRLTQFLVPKTLHMLVSLIYHLLRPRLDRSLTKGCLSDVRLRRLRRSQIKSIA